MNKNGKRNCKNGVILHLRFECHISRNFYSCLWPSHSEYLKYANVNCDITISRGVGFLSEVLLIRLESHLKKNVFYYKSSEQDIEIIL